MHATHDITPDDQRLVMMRLPEGGGAGGIRAPALVSVENVFEELKAKWGASGERTSKLVARPTAADYGDVCSRFASFRDDRERGIYPFASDPASLLVTVTT